MPVMMIMEWEGITPDHYEQARNLINWEGDVPQGAIYHVASYDGNAMRITDVWESAEDFQHFVDNRLMPGIRQLGIPGQPKVEIHPVHRIFAPAYNATREGVSGSPGRS